MTDVDPQFVLGLIAGEGTFNVALHDQPRKSRHGVRPRTQMAVKMDPRDADLLKLCQESTGLGTYHEYGKFAVWMVSSKEDCQSLVEYVEGHAGAGFRSSDKWESFDLWRDVVEIVGDPYKRLTKEETVECIEKAKSMNSTEIANEMSAEEWKEKVV